MFKVVREGGKEETKVTYSHLQLYPEGRHMKQREEVVHQLVLLRQEPTTHLRLTQAQQHGEQLETVRV